MNAGCEHPESRDLTTTTRLQVGLMPAMAHLSQPFLGYFTKISDIKLQKISRVHVFTNHNLVYPN